MIDPVRPEVRDSIVECRRAGIRPIMITGDHIDTAVAIAKDLGILSEGKRAVTGAELGAMSDEEFASLPYGSEGLWRKLMHNARTLSTLEEIITATKSKRYTRTRLNRMAMCAFLGITQADMAQDVPYTRVLAFSDRGRALLNKAKKDWVYLNAGEAADHPHWELEKRCGDLYGLFREDGPDAPGAEERRRVYYHKEITNK